MQEYIRRPPWDKANIKLDEMGILKPHLRMLTAAVAPLLWHEQYYAEKDESLHYDIYIIMVRAMGIENSGTSYPLSSIIKKYPRSFYTEAENCRLLYNGYLSVVRKIETLFKQETDNEFYQHRALHPLSEDC